MYLKLNTETKIKKIDVTKIVPQKLIPEIKKWGVIIVI